MSEAQNKTTAVESPGTSKMTPKLWFQWAIALGLPLAIAMIPPTPVYTKPVINFFAVTTWAVFSWIFGIIPEVVVGFLLPPLYIVFGVATANEAFSPWLTNVPWISFGGLALSAMMMTSGLAKRIAYWAILVVGGTYKKTLAGLLFGGLIIAPLIPSIMGKIAIFALLGVAICQALNLEPGSRAASGVMMGAFLAVAGPKLSYLTGSGDTPLAMGLVAKVTGTMISWGEFALHNAVIGVIYSILALLVLYVTLKPEKEFDSLEAIRGRFRELGPMSTDEKKAAVFLAVTLFLLVTDFWHKINIGWILIIVSGILFIPRVGVLKPDQLGKMGLPMLFFISGAMAIGPIAAKAGVVKVVAGVLVPLLKGSTVYTFMSVYVFGVLLKFFLTPLAATAMFVSTIAETAIQMGIHPYPLVYMFKYGIDQYIFPYEYAVLLYTYSFGYMTLASVLKVMIPRIFVTAIFLVLIAIPWWKLCGLL